MAYLWDFMMFYGETAVNLDSKGRLAIPVRHRDLISSACENKLVITRNVFEKDSLWVYPQKDWEKMRDEVSQLSSFNPMHRQLQRVLIGSAYHVEPDKGSRILLPVTLRQGANLEKSVVILGMGNKFEIWNEETLMQSRNEVLDMGDNVTDAIKNLVI